MVNFRFHAYKSRTKIKSTNLFKPVNMFRLSHLSVGLTQVLNSLKGKSDYNAVKFSYELNFRHAPFISYLLRFTAKDFWISRLTEYTSITIHGTVFFLSNHDSPSTLKKTGSRRHENTLAPPPPPSPIPSYALIFFLMDKLKCHEQNNWHQNQSWRQNNLHLRDFELRYQLIFYQGYC